jgi:hypothetical protein
MILNERRWAMRKYDRVTRFEVIDDTGRVYVRQLNKDERVTYSMQDDDRTVKFFIVPINTV